MKYTIKNNELTVELNDYGAEISSIKKTGDKIEYLWQLNEDVWERQAPLLFPLIGRLKNETYVYDNKSYNIPIHGFANTSIFNLEYHDESEIVFSLSDSDSTLKVYPFKFKLLITYTLVNNSIVKKHNIVNLSDHEMFFEIGGHEGFNLALLEGEKMEDYYIEFYNQEEIKTYTTDEDIMINKNKSTVKLDSNRLYLSPEVFKNDALIIDEFEKRVVAIKNTKNDREVIVNFEEFKYLGLWTKYMRSNYVCIEPWSSLPDANYLDMELKNKQDIIKLEKNSEKELSYIMTIK